MGCGSCATGSCGSAIATPTGSSNSACGTKGCNKLNSFDWLGNMELPGAAMFDVVEVKFKGGRKDFFRNIHQLDIEIGDPVIVEATNGYHLGYVSLRGELVRLQMSKKKVENDDKIKAVYRIAAERDLEKFDQVKAKELAVMFRTREIVNSLNLKMKLSDVEFQADNTKATFYYSADERVDFRELIKIIASEFKIRVEMRQISLRQEASRLGGLGSCGRELCCSTWLTEFKSVSTGAARYQNLSLNPTKLSGQCGRLKCCLNYELETYLDALIDIPKLEKPLLLSKGSAQLQKVDIFKKVLWFSFESETTWFPLNTDQVKEIQERNKKGESVEIIPVIEVASPQQTDENPFTVSLHDDIDRLDQKQKRKGKKRKRPTGKKGTPEDAKPVKTNGMPQNGESRQPNPRNQEGPQPVVNRHPNPPKPRANAETDQKPVAENAQKKPRNDGFQKRNPKGKRPHPKHRRPKGNGSPPATEQ